MNLDVVLGALSQVVGPAYYAFAFILYGARIRWRLRERPSRRLIVRSVTLATWLLVIGSEFGFLLRSAPLVIAASILMYVVSERHLAIANALFRPDLRFGASDAANLLFGSFRDPEGTPVDEATIRTGLDDLDRWQSPATFEFIQVTRLYVVTRIGDPYDERLVAWSARLETIAAGWVAGQPWDSLERLGTRIRRVVLAGGTVLAAAAGIVVGAAYRDQLPVALVVTVVWAYLAAWAAVFMRVALGLIGFGIGFAWWMSQDSYDCGPSCDTVTRTRIAVAVVAIVIGAVIGVLDPQRRARSGPKLSVVA
jgi:hypothetical protein